ncbi:Synaptotagmin-like protein 5 [Larimichthys crocea]|uniref:Uncharacterized protein n=1 Tax=Larimichthys crocea TaxID=215358 RepID=A0ACD3QHV7_LARCR|nr:Synaptotagmin-like protein 5 [Larimichthys crocea]
MEQVGEDLNLSYLLEHERDMILKVLQKDEKLRKREEKRIRKLKNELLEIKRKGSRRSHELGERQCARCLKTLGLIFDRGDLCEECQLRVCNDCRVKTPNSRQWRCNVCAKILELKVVTGEWFLEERSKRFEQGVPSGDVIKQTILSSPIRAVRWPWSPQGCQRSPTTCVPKLRTDLQLRATTGGSGLTERRALPALHSSDSTSEKKAAGNHRTDSGTPTISVSRASVSSDHSRSEMDLSAPGSEPSDDTFSNRSRSVPGLNETEFSDDDVDEDIDALMSAHSKTHSRRLSNAVSTSSINSMMSLYSETGDYGNARVSGEILLNIGYSYKTGALNVLVKECHNLATGDERRQRTDAYVKTYLLPDTSRQSKRKTSIKANTINPIFNENLRYVISHSQLETRTLQVSVWHHDRFGHNSFLGEVELTFDSWEFDSQIEEWYALQPKVEGSIDSTMQYKGELTVVLKYIPAEKNLMLPLDQVQVKKGFLKSKKTSSFTLPKGGMVELLVKGAKNLTAVKSWRHF